MARNRFTLSEFVRLPLSDDDWVEVKKDLNNGEVKRLEAAGMKPPTTDSVTGKLVNSIDWEVYEIDRTLIYLTDWSLRDAQDKPVKISRDALRALDPASFDEINTAIFEHALRRAAEKKALRAVQPPSKELSS